MGILWEFPHHSGHQMNPSISASTLPSSCLLLLAQLLSCSLEIEGTKMERLQWQEWRRGRDGSRHRESSQHWEPPRTCFYPTSQHKPLATDWGQQKQSQAKTVICSTEWQDQDKGPMGDGQQAQSLTQCLSEGDAGLEAAPERVCWGRKAREDIARGTSLEL